MRVFNASSKLGAKKYKYAQQKSTGDEGRDVVERTLLGRWTSAPWCAAGRAGRRVRGNRTLFKTAEGEARRRQGKTHGKGRIRGLHTECRTSRIHTKVTRKRVEVPLRRHLASTDHRDTYKTCPEVSLREKTKNWCRRTDGPVAARVARHAFRWT